MRQLIKIIILVSLSLNSFAQTRFGDKNNPIILCKKVPVQIRNLNGPGEKSYEIEHSSCSDRFVERHTVWLEWEAANDGNLTFQIIPNNENNDYDFIIYKKFPNKEFLEEIRCMASGEMIGGNIERSLPCMGKTGLYCGTNDLFERDGCSENSDNYLSDLKQEKGVCYLLLINNYHSNEGFNIEFGGNAEFKMPSIYSQIFPKNYPKNLEIARLTTYYSDVYENKVKINSKNQRPIGQKWIFADLWNDNMNNELTLIGCKEIIENTKIIDRADENNAANLIQIGDPFPNPSSLLVQLKINVDKNYDANLTIQDLYGRRIKSKNLILQKGSQIIDLPIEELAAGSYLINIRIENNIYIRKFVKILF